MSLINYLISLILGKTYMYSLSHGHARKDFLSIKVLACIYQYTSFEV